MKQKALIPFIYICVLMVLASCNSHPALPESYNETHKLPQIYPDYTHVTIPSNIAPLNFMVTDADECVAHIQWDGLI